MGIFLINLLIACTELRESVHCSLPALSYARVFIAILGIQLK